MRQIWQDPFHTCRDVVSALGREAEVTNGTGDPAGTTAMWLCESPPSSGIRCPAEGLSCQPISVPGSGAGLTHLLVNIQRCICVSSRHYLLRAASQRQRPSGEYTELNRLTQSAKKSREQRQRATEKILATHCDKSYLKCYTRQVRPNFRKHVEKLTCGRFLHQTISSLKATTSTHVRVLIPRWGRRSAQRGAHRLLTK